MLKTVFSLVVFLFLFHISLPLVEGSAAPIVDSDSDGVDDSHDNCVGHSNPSQADYDGDGIGDPCEQDRDNDGIDDQDDNCPTVVNPDQGDFDGDTVGDACDPQPEHNPHNCPHDHHNPHVTPSPTPYPSTTPTPTPSPTPTPEKKKCNVYRVDSVASNDAYLSGDLEALELRSILSRADLDRLYATYNGFKLCHILIGEKQFFLSSRHTKVSCGVVGPYHFGFRGNEPFGTLFFDVNGGRLSPEYVAQSGCHIKHLIVGFDPTSPISLIWDESTIPSTKLADFPLQPNANGRVFGWRGSAEWPLLVYDPGHTGVITSPHQLFGNWTFGGKRVASLGASTGNKNQSAWENGYEALEILDADRDGKVSGEELAPLGLWFDRNRDGVSQPGEVQSLKDLEVTELFYKSSATDPVTGDIYASNGFTRIVDGKPVLGRSVDWYARSYNSKVEAALSIKTNVAPEASAPAETQQVSRVNLSREALLKTGENLLGVWRWRSHTADKNGNFPEGLVVFEELDGPSLRGYTLVEMQLKEKPGYLAKSMVTLSRLHGSLLKTSDEEIHIEFTVTASDGHITRTRATLDIALKTLKGESKSRRSDNGKINPSTFEVDYSWTAKELRHDTK